MSYAVMISIRPRWCELIASGKKTVEVRKTCPKIDTPFKCYIYCAKPKQVLQCVLTKADYEGYPGYEKIPDDMKYFFKLPDGTSPFCSPPYSSKVIGEFMCDAILRHCETGNADTAEQQGCIRREELLSYANGKELYGWHISDLKIYDKPRGLSEFYAPTEKYCEKQLCGSCPKDQVMGLDGDYEFDCERKRPIKRAPQSWCYVEEIR